MSDELHPSLDKAPMALKLEAAMDSEVEKMLVEVSASAPGCPACGGDLLFAAADVPEEWPWGEKMPELLHWKCPHCGARLEEEGDEIRMDPRGLAR